MKILITAGATRQYIDPVRFISNASSGKMGQALAGTARKAGHKVTLITTVSTSRPKTQDPRLKTVEVVTAEQMFEAVKEHFSDCECLIMAAAVADYTPVRPSRAKIKKSRESLILKLKPTTDILKWAGKHKKNKGKLVVGFALEDKNLRRNAEKKLLEKKLDMIVANSPAAIGTGESTVHIKTPGRDWLTIENKKKTTIARYIIKQVEFLKDSR